MFKRLHEMFLNYKLYYVFVIFIVTFLVVVLLWVNIPRLDYKLDVDNDEYYIDRLFGNIDTVKIPSEYKGKPVTKIGKRAFEARDNLRNVIFSEDNNIEIIETSAFENCVNLKTITIPKEVRLVGD
ncbi:MAG: leucine-rich repeat protein, partial [Anaeroplasmataceae bacterium]